MVAIPELGAWTWNVMNSPLTATASFITLPGPPMKSSDRFRVGLQVQPPA
jgi:hypothetical protein